jgi:hypothetical protein
MFNTSLGCIISESGPQKIPLVFLTVASKVKNAKCKNAAKKVTSAHILWIYPAVG